MPYDHPESNYGMTRTVLLSKVSIPAGNVHPVPTEGLTLQQIERRLDRSPEAAAYLRALRAARYAPTGDAPTTRGRRALRRELGSGAGPRGRLRALWSLPPWRA